MRSLVLNLGNTSLHGGVFRDGKLASTFRLATREAATTAGFDALLAPRLPRAVDRVALCSVVPWATEVIAPRLQRALKVEPRRLLHDAPHGLNFGYRKPRELGLDRLAAALGARALWPKENVIVVDCGTATTVTALSAAGVVEGGAIFPGLALWAEMLALRTAQLPRLAAGVKPPERALGRGTREGIASGLHFGHAGAIRELVARIGREAFGKRAFSVIGTGGNAERFAAENLFAHHEPHLILLGLHAFAHA